MQELFIGFVPLNNKRPIKQFRHNEDLLSESEADIFPEYAGKLAKNTLMLDFDTDEHFNIFVNIAKALKVKCKAEKSTRGGHVYFVGRGCFNKCGTHITLAIGLEADIKVGNSNSISRVKANGLKHTVVYDIDPDDQYDSAPVWITPLNKGAYVPDFIHLEKGMRNQTLFNYILTLENNTKTRLRRNDIREIITIINSYILPNKLTENELKSILRDEAFKKQDVETPEINSVYDLMQEDIKPIEFIVKDFLPVGLNILASPPKFGKSWFALLLCLSVSAGARFLNFETKQSTVYYLALEDSKARLQKRVEKLLGNNKPSKCFYYGRSINDLSNDCITQLELILKVIPECKLIVIDTLQYIRGSRGKTEGVYDYDYNNMKQLKRFADSHELCILVIHHTRKDNNPNDPFANISGTNGITGACDSMFVFTKEDRNSNQAKLSITGRDIDQQELALTLNDCKWTYEGKADDIQRKNDELRFRADPLFNTIYSLLETNSGKWEGTCQEIINHSKKIGFVLDESKKKKPDVSLGMNICKYDEKLKKYAGIIHQVIDKNGTAGNRHLFYFD